MAANGPITGIQQHFNLYRVREIEKQRNVSAATFDHEREVNITTDEEGGENDNRKWIPPKIEADMHKPRIPLPMSIKSVIYTPEDAGLEHLTRRGLIGNNNQSNALSELYLGNFNNFLRTQHTTHTTTCYITDYTTCNTTCYSNMYLGKYFVFV